jgi:hypothetical protein
VTLAPGIAAPLGSFTVPTMLPKIDCASRVETTEIVKAASNTTTQPFLDTPPSSESILYRGQSNFVDGEYGELRKESIKTGMNNLIGRDKLS